MSQIEYIRNSLQSLHQSLDEAMEGLSGEQAHWRPQDRGNHISFIAWHYTRTEDNIVGYVLQRRPTMWMAGKWDEKFGLDSRAQGTGMIPEDAAALEISDIPSFCTYMGEVWDMTRSYLDTIGDGDLERTLTVRPLGEQTLEQVLGNTLLTHGYTHLGEIWLLRGLQGLPGSPI